MQNLDTITNLQEILDSISEVYAELNNFVDQLKSAISAQEFIPETLGMSIREKLTYIMDSQKRFKSQYDSLGITVPVCTIPTLKEVLADRYKFLSEKQVFLDIISFVTSLHSDNEEIQAELEKEQKYLAAYDCRTNPVDQCKEDLGKYFLLQEAIQTKDPLSRFTLIMDLGQFFHVLIPFGINTGAISLRDMTEETVSQDTTMSSEAGMEDTTPLSPETEPVAEVSESAKVIENSADEVFPASESTEEQEESLDSTEEIFNKFTDTVGEKIFEDLEEEKGIADITVFSEEEKEAVTEDCDLLCDTETIKSASEEAPVTPIAEPEVVPVIETPAPAVVSSWEDLGIYDASAFKYHVKDKKLAINFNQVSRKFSAGTFKKDISPKTAYGLEKKDLMKFAFENGGVIIESYANYVGRDLALLKAAAAKLVHNGYFKEYILKKNDTESYDPYYVLMPFGYKAFTTKEASAALDRHPVKPESLGETIPDTANSVLTRILSARSLDLYRNLFGDNPPSQFNGRHLVSTDYFIRHFYTDDEKKVFAYTAIIASMLSSFDEYKKDILKQIDDLHVLIVLGDNLQRIKTLTEWISSFVGEAASKVYYYNPETELYYSLSSEEPVDMYQLTQDAPEEITKESKEDISVEEIIPEEIPAIAEASEISDVSDDVADSEESEAVAEEEPIEEEALPVLSEEELSPVMAEEPVSEEAEKPVATEAEEVIVSTESPAKEEIAEEEAETETEVEVVVTEEMISTPSEEPEISSNATETANSADAIETVKAPVKVTDPTLVLLKEKDLFLSASDKAKYTTAYQEMLATEQFHCAATYTRALSLNYKAFKPVYKQLAYALNDPAANCTYSSDEIFNIFFSEDTQLSDYYVISAVLRNFFLDQRSYDYALRMLHDSISGLELLQDNPALNKVIYTLLLFKETNHRGMDYYADYRQKKREAYEETLRTLRDEAKELYEFYCLGKETGNFSRRMANTKKIIYGNGSDMATYIEAVASDNREYFSLIEDYLKNTFIKNDMEISADNIDSAKIEAVINDAWDQAGNMMTTLRKSADLMGSYRTNTFKQIQKLVTVLCNYISTVGSDSVNIADPALIDYKRSQKELMANINESIENIQANVAEDRMSYAGQRVLLMTLHNLLSRLDGSYEEGSNQYFHLDFLKNDKVFLDESYLPVLYDVAEIPELSILARIEAHYTESTVSFEERLRTILEGGDDFNSARLILTYLKTHPEPFEDERLLLAATFDEAIIYPKKDMENRRRDFIGNLELAQSYGQIDNTTEDRKETLIGIMDIWYEWAMDSNNYGFFYKITEAIQNKIRSDSQIRAVDLENHLAAYQEGHLNWKSDPQISDAIKQVKNRINAQNYAAAEDLLNRIIAGDLNTEKDFLETDYLTSFLDEYTFNVNRAGRANISLQASLLRSHNKDTKAAGRLIENWPKGKYTPAKNISNLLRVLGFPVDNVESMPSIQGKDHYQVTLQKPANGRKSNYKHPISVFGSEAEDKGFRVICIYGMMDAGRLIDIFKEIGSAKNTMILLDYALSLPDRRELARRTKTEFNSKTFIVIDRVVLIYLALHYSETAVNRMLMAITVPFAACQPYVSDSATPMPAEIFMGRKLELDKIESPAGVNIVYGGRQLGKSALLSMAQKDINHDENGDRAVLVDIKGRDYKQACRKVSENLVDEGILEEEQITEEWPALARAIKNRLRDTSPEKNIPYLLLLMDEADVFIESCEAVDYAPFDALKDIQSIGSQRFKFVVAGLRNIVRFKKNIALGKNSVLTHLSSLTVTPFKSAEARELLEVPLSYLGFRFPDDTNTEMLISTIFGTTNYFPGLIQLYCTKLIEAVQRDYAGYDESETPPYVVKEAHIKKVLSDKTLEQQIREKYFITLKVDEDDYYYLIALLLAFNYHNNTEQNGCNASDIIETAQTFEINKISSLSLDKVSALMEEMRELNVLQLLGNGNYRFARHSFCQMMGSTSEIDDEIMSYALMQEE